MKCWKILVVVFGSFTLISCSENRTPGTFEVTFRNCSTNQIWVESAKVSKKDISCGWLYEGVVKKMIFPKLKESPSSIDIEWWEGSSQRPSSKSAIFSQTVVLEKQAENSRVLSLELDFINGCEWELQQRE